MINNDTINDTINDNINDTINDTINYTINDTINDNELDIIYNEWDMLEKENMLYYKIRRETIIFLVLSFFNLMVNYMIFLIQNDNSLKNKIDKISYSVEDID